MTYPNQLPEWASAPADPPNDIIDPGSSQKQAGWQPDDRPPAPWMNWWQNLVYQWIAAFAIAAVRNWTLVRDISPTTPQQFRGLGYDESTGTLIVTGDTADVATFRSLNGGITWVTPSTPPAALPNCRAIASDNAGNWCIGGDSPSISESSDDGDTWTLRSVGGTNDNVNFISYDPANSLWIATGDNDGGTPGRRLWTSPDRVTWTARISDSGGVGTFLNRVWTNQAGFSVAIYDSGIYTSPDGINWTARTAPGASGYDDVVYSEGAGIWMLLGSDGSDRIWTSPDGITWTAAGAPGGSNSKISCDQGGLFIVGDGSTTAKSEIRVSTDQGATWTQVTGWGDGLARGPAEGSPTPTGSGSIAQRFYFFARRFMRVDNAGNFWFSQAL